MKKTLTAKLALAGVVALALVGATATAATAADEPAAAPFYIWDADENFIPSGAERPWDEFILGSPSGTDMGAPFLGSDDATGVLVFLSNPGDERDIQAWKGRNLTGFKPDSKEVIYPKVSIDVLSGETMGQIKATGGVFSLGIAFTKGMNVQIAEAGVAFATVTIKPGGAWSYVPTEAGAPAEPPVGEADIALEATTVSATDGSLQLSVPANAKATFGEAALVGGLSTSTAVLPEFTVSDARVVTSPGWTLTQSTANFTSGQATIDAKHLGVAPKIISAGTTSTSAQAAQAQVAGVANNTGAAFAAATAGAGSIGDTKLSADLTLVAPADAPAGTYTSKMTLTLVSK